VGWRVPRNAGDLLARALDDQWRVYRKQLRQCQNEFSETSVHQLRVATRRLMTRFDLVGCLIANERADRARRKLKQRLRFLGELRDLQVQIGFIEEHLQAYPELSLLLDEMEAREQVTATEVAVRVLRMKPGKLKKWTRSCCDDLACPPAGNRREQPLAARTLHSLAAAFQTLKMRRQMIDPANSETLHRTRVAFKKFRYMVEALSPSFTGLAKTQLRRFGTYQRRMGNVQDLEVLQAYIAQFLNHHPEAATSLQPFCKYLARRRARALRSCLARVDDLFELYQPAELQDGPQAVTRHAA